MEIVDGGYKEKVVEDRDYPLNHLVTAHLKQKRNGIFYSFIITSTFIV